MCELTELRQWLERARSQSPNTQAAIESAMAVFLKAAGDITALEAIQVEAKTLLGEIMIETGVSEMTTRVGKAQIGKPATIVTYDSKALDKASLLDLELAAALQPYRRITERAGTMRITGAK